MRGARRSCLEEELRASVWGRCLEKVPGGRLDTPEGYPEQGGA